MISFMIMLFMVWYPQQCLYNTKSTLAWICLPLKFNYLAKNLFSLIHLDSLEMAIGISSWAEVIILQVQHTKSSFVNVNLEN